MSSLIEFKRWESKLEFSIPYSSYVSYNSELRRMFRAIDSSKRYVYKSLNTDRKAKWEDNPNKYFDFHPQVKKTYAFFETLKEWSDSLNSFMNWNNLNTLVAVAANFEIYLSQIIRLALESDCGIIYGLNHEIDGIKVLKNNISFDFSKAVESCTKGEWSVRNNNIKRLFKDIPTIFEKECGTLDKIRKLRNDIAHSFGRNIEDSHDIERLDRISMAAMNDNVLLKYWDTIDECVKELDIFLINNHIGEYQLLLFYHKYHDIAFKNIDIDSKSIKEKANIFRKFYGQKTQKGPQTYGALFWKGLVEYYESI